MDDHLKPGAPESREGFLLNPLIPELLQPDADGYQHSNADPVTGQAAWYDLKVRLEKATAEEAAEAQIADLTPPPGLPPSPDELRYGAGFAGRAR